jgi:hypothetical protein
MTYEIHSTGVTLCLAASNISEVMFALNLEWLQNAVSSILAKDKTIKHLVSNCRIIRPISWNPIYSRLYKLKSPCQIKIFGGPRLYSACNILNERFIMVVNC